MKWFILVYFIVILCPTKTKSESTPPVPQCDEIKVSIEGSTYYSSLMLVTWACSVLYTHAMDPPKCSFHYGFWNKDSFGNSVNENFIKDEVRIAWKGDPVYFNKSCVMRLPVEYLVEGSYKFRSTWELPFHTLSVDSSILDLVLSNKMTCTDPYLTNSKQEIVMSCQGSGLYPQVSCRLQYSQGNKPFIDTYFQSSSASPHCDWDPARCSYNCTVTKKVKELGVGWFRFKMLVAPKAANGVVVNKYKTFGPTPPIHLVPPAPLSTISADIGNPIYTPTIPENGHPISTVDNGNRVSTSTSTISVGNGNPVSTHTISVDNRNPVLKVGPPQFANTKDIPNVYPNVQSGADLKIDIAITGYPVPTAYVLVKIQNNPQNRKRDSEKGLVDSSVYNVTFKQGKPPIGIVVLEMFGLDVDDSGQYALTISNGIGNGLVFQFHVSVTFLSTSVDRVEEGSVRSDNYWRWIGAAVGGSLLLLAVGGAVGLLVGLNKKRI